MNGQDAVVLVGKPELGAPQAAFYVTEAETLPLDSEYTFLYRGDGTVDVNLRYGDFDWGWQCCHLTLTPASPFPNRAPRRASSSRAAVWKPVARPSPGSPGCPTPLPNPAGANESI